MSQAAFILGIVLINFSLFLPNYFINKDESTFFPDTSRLKNTHRRGIWFDYNLDPFRLSMDISLMIFIAYLTKSRWLVLFIPCYYGFIQLYNLYHCSFRKIYKTHPVFINDWKLLKTGLGFLYAESKIKLIAGALAGVLLLGIACFMIGDFIRFSIGMRTNLILTIIGILFFSYYLIKVSIFSFYNPIFDLIYRFNFFPFRIYYNLKMCYHLKKSKERLKSRLNTHEEKQSFELKKKPNIHFLCVESYGSILLKNEELTPRYLSLYQAFNKKLNDIGYHTVSNLSESVSLVGPSWLAYTTLQLGLKVESNYEYEYLLAQKPASYPSLAKGFQRNGYTSYHINPIKPHTGIAVPYQRIKELYGIDQFVLYDDIPYHGTRYGISETPPDQYVLNHTREKLLKKSDHPYFLFYLTKNSHSPFKSPEKVLSNWKDWKETENTLIGKKFLKVPTFEDYLKAIDYQLKAIHDYIAGFDDDNVFIIIGDHQPHHIVHKDHYGMETIAHVVSKNQEFCNRLKNFGFNEDLTNIQRPIKHEDLKGIIEKALLASYS